MGSLSSLPDNFRGMPNTQWSTIRPSFHFGCKTFLNSLCCDYAAQPGVCVETSFEGTIPAVTEKRNTDSLFVPRWAKTLRRPRRRSETMFSLGEVSPCHGDNPNLTRALPHKHKPTSAGTLITWYHEKTYAPEGFQGKLAFPIYR